MIKLHALPSSFVFPFTLVDLKLKRLLRLTFRDDGSVMGYKEPIMERAYDCTHPSLPFFLA